mmetsp:Transcript_69031/g.223158  ORF Transcript_69031/g.223158 Transcript_69031/m.223158 type:complete len:229 (+) Transcript_69031:1469-2155(+)
MLARGVVLAGPDHVALLARVPDVHAGHVLVGLGLRTLPLRQLLRRDGGRGLLLALQHRLHRAHQVPRELGRQRLRLRGVRARARVLLDRGGQVHGGARGGGRQPPHLRLHGGRAQAQVLIAVGLGPQAVAHLRPHVGTGPRRDGRALLIRVQDLLLQAAEGHRHIAGGLDRLVVRVRVGSWRHMIQCLVPRHQELLGPPRGPVRVDGHGAAAGERCGAGLRPAAGLEP